MPSVELTNKAISAGISALLAMQKPTGRFVYRTGAVIPEKELRYNILRHCGALYALTECEHLSSEDVAPYVRKGLRWVEKDHLRPIIRQRLLLSVASDDSGRGVFEPSKLGGTALFLLAAVRAREAGQLAYPLSALRAMGGFLLSMQNEGGGFHSKYLRHRRRVDTSFHSLYYPGEAALALLHLGSLETDERWVPAAERALLFLADSRRGRSVVEPDHWALIATDKYLRLCADQQKQPNPVMYEHAIQIAQSMLTEYETGPSAPGLGCFTHDGRTCPTATRLEGLIAILPHIVNIADADFRTRLTRAIEHGVSFLLEAQIRTGKRAGGFTRTSGAWKREFDDDSRGDEVRIDYIQHAISALRGFVALPA